jgi:catechol 2,3-dioxygenase-like lactoylglutathione lyase family enzyme
MPLNRFEHVLVLSDRPKVTRDFFVKVLGLKDGYRPPFPFPGYWLYLGSTPCIHLAGKIANAGQAYYLDQKGTPKINGGTGPIDHIAFVADDLEGTKRRLKRHKLEIRERVVPEQNMVQLFVKDPNDITIELNFPASEDRRAAPAAIPVARRRAPVRRGTTAKAAPRRRAKPEK